MGLMKPGSRSIGSPGNAFASIAGARKLEKAFRDIASVGMTNEMMGHMNRAAKLTKKAIRRRIPVGPTGNLRRAVEIRSKRGYWAYQNSPEVVVAMDWGIAPHTYIVEYGHANVRGGVRYANRASKTAGPGKVIGQVQGVRYFQRGIDASRQQATRIIENGAQKIIKKAW